MSAKADDTVALLTWPAIGSRVACGCYHGCAARGTVVEISSVNNMTRYAVDWDVPAMSARMRGWYIERQLRRVDNE